MADVDTLTRAIAAAAKARRTAAQCKPVLRTLAESFDALARRDREALLMVATLGDGWGERPAVPVLKWLLAHGMSPDLAIAAGAYPLPKGTPLLSALAWSLDHPRRGGTVSAETVAKNNAQIELGMVALLDAGAKPNVQDRQRATPLHRAAEHGAIVAMRALLARGAKLETKNKSGATPLFYAACSDSPAAVELLLDAGAKLATNRDGDTAYDAAIAYGAARTAALLAKRSKVPLAGNASISAAEITRVLARRAKQRHSIIGMSGAPDPVTARFVRGGTVSDRRVIVKLDVAKLPKLAPAVRRELITALGNEAKLWLAEQGVNTTSYNIGPASPWYQTAGSKSSKRAGELFAAMRKS